MYLTLAEIQAFINFVNGNVGKKIFSDENPATTVAGKKLITNGVGLGVDIVNDISYQLGISGNWDIDLINTPPNNVIVGQRYSVTTSGTYYGISAEIDDIVEFTSLTSIFVYPKSSTLVRLSTLDDYATKTYAQNLVAGLLDDRGSFDASITGNYPTSANNGSGVAGVIMKGDIWFISANGFVGTKPVYTGYSVRALIDNPGQTENNWDILNVGLGYVPENVSRKKTSTNGALDAPDDIDYPTTKVVSDGLALKANIAHQTHTGNTRLPSSLKFYDVGTNTKEVGLDISQVSAATTRTITVPNRNVTLGDIPIFQATTNYKQYSVIQQNGTIYSAKVDFTSGASFSAGDWTALGSSMIKESFSGNLTLQIGHEYYNVSPPNTAITLELPDPTLIPDGSVIIIHNLAFNSTTTLGRSAWPLPAPSVFLQAPEYTGFTSSVIPAYSKGVITTLSSISGTGWLVEKQNSNVIALSSTPGAGKTYFTREDDVSATLSYNLGAIPASTNRVITMPNADVNLGLVGQTDFLDTVFRVSDNTDATKKIAFEASGIGTGKTKKITMPNADVDLGKQIITSSYDTETGLVVFGNVDGTNTTLNLKGARRWAALPSDASILQPPVDTFFEMGVLDRSVNITPMLQEWIVVWEFCATQGDIQVTLRKGTSGYIYDVHGNTLVSNQTSYVITIPSNTTLKIEGVYNRWTITYGSGQETYARSGKLGLVSTAGTNVSGVITKYKTNFAHNSGSGFTSNTTVTIPSVDVDLGSIPAVGAFNSNSVSNGGTILSRNSKNSAVNGVVLVSGDSLKTGFNYSTPGVAVVRTGSSEHDFFRPAVVETLLTDFRSSSTSNALSVIGAIGAPVTANKPYAASPKGSDFWGLGGGNDILAVHTLTFGCSLHGNGTRYIFSGQRRIMVRRVNATNTYTIENIQTIGVDVGSAGVTGINVAITLDDDRLNIVLSHTTPSISSMLTTATLTSLITSLG